MTCTAPTSIAVARWVKTTVNLGARSATVEVGVHESVDNRVKLSFTNEQPDVMPTYKLSTTVAIQRGSRAEFGDDSPCSPQFVAVE